MQARRRVPDGGVEPGINTDVVTIPKKRLVRRGTTTDSILLCTSATQEPIGVTMEEIGVGRVGDVQVDGKTIVEAGAAIAVDDQIGSDSVGRGVAVIAPGEFFIGKANSAALALGDDAEVEFA